MINLGRPNVDGSEENIFLWLIIIPNLIPPKHFWLIIIPNPDGVIPSDG